MNQLPIVRRCMISSMLVETILDPLLFFSTDDMGETHQRREKIRIQSNVAGVPRSRQAISRDQIHEFCHDWLDAIGHPELSNDETFVIALSGVIHLSLETAEFFSEEELSCSFPPS